MFEVNVKTGGDFFAAFDDVEETLVAVGPTVTGAHRPVGARADFEAARGNRKSFRCERGKWGLVEQKKME